MTDDSLHPTGPQKGRSRPTGFLARDHQRRRLTANISTRLGPRCVDGRVGIATYRNAASGNDFAASRWLECSSRTDAWKPGGNGRWAEDGGVLRERRLGRACREWPERAARFARFGGVPSVRVQTGARLTPIRLTVLLPFLPGQHAADERAPSDRPDDAVDRNSKRILEASNSRFRQRTEDAVDLEALGRIA